MKNLIRTKIASFDFRSVIFISFCLYLFLAFAGINQSNLSAISMSGQKSIVQTYSGSGYSIGIARDIRSDEFLRSTPMLINFLRNNENVTTSQLTLDTPFSFNIPTFNSDLVIFPEYALIKLLPIPFSSKFSLIWWLPFILLFISLVKLGDYLGTSRKTTYFVFCALIFAPGSTWWSHMANPIFYNFLFAAFLLIRKGERGWIHKLVPLISGYFIVRAVSYYQPWALVFGSVMILASAMYTFRNERFISSLQKIGLLITGFVLFAFIRFYPHEDGLRALFQTVYPGQRRSTGGEQIFEFLFSTPFLWRSQFPNLEIINTNQSEISSFFILPGLALFIIQIFLLIRSKNIDAKVSAGLFGGIVATFWGAWAFIDFGSLGEGLLLINRVPGFRAAQMVGSCFIILILFLNNPALKLNYAHNFLLSIAFVILTIYSGMKIKHIYLPQISNFEIFLVALITSLVVVLFLNYSEKWIFASITYLLMFSIVMIVNPVNIGIGEFDGKISQRITALNSEDQGVWASDSIYSDSILMSSGIESLSAQQSTGPSQQNWLILDPKNEFFLNWNRASSYITFRWSDSNSVKISNPSPDIILIDADPCSQKLKTLGLKYFITSNSTQIFECAAKITEFQLMGQINKIYKIG